MNTTGHLLGRAVASQPKACLPIADPHNVINATKDWQPRQSFNQTRILSMTSRLERTTKELRDQGLLYWKVEYWNPWAKIKVDLFNIIDLVVLDQTILGIQVCGTDLAAHVRKIRDEYKEYTLEWLRSGGSLQIWAWRRVKVKRGGKAMVWKPRVMDVLLVNDEIYVEEQC